MTFQVAANPDAFSSGEQDAPSEVTADQNFTSLSELLTSGGDDRILVNAETGRNEYGTSVAPAPNEICFSSSTASTISGRGWQAVERAALGVMADTMHRRNSASTLCDAVRSRLGQLYGAPDTDVVLTASGTDAELVALTIFERLQARPITNIIVAPAETGSGVVNAAAGLSFRSQSCLGGAADAGRRLEGLEDADIEVVAIQIRSSDGALRDAAQVDLEAATETERALARGRFVILHVLDTSKTGVAGVSRSVARAIATAAPKRVQVIVDACQLRCPPEQIRSDLADGFIVVVTGSKFAGGPPFSGALLLPGTVSSALQTAQPPPAGLASYSARDDWPSSLRQSFAANLGTANTGAALRWTAALAELDRLEAVSSELQGRIVRHFEAEVCYRARETLFAQPLFDETFEIARARSIVPLIACHCNGAALDTLEIRILHQALRTSFPSRSDDDSLQRIIHVGQPVMLGPRSVIRICTGASQIADIAGRMADGATMEQAFVPINQDLDSLFAKWAALTNCGT